VLARVPEFERDITGLEMIGKVADALFGEAAPVDVRARGAGGEA